MTATPIQLSRRGTGWIDRNILALGREMRLSYMPPLMVYACRISGLTGIVGAFYVKEQLGLSAEFLAALGFWMMLPWALKMPLGHWWIWSGGGRACWCPRCGTDHAQHPDHDRSAGPH